MDILVNMLILQWEITALVLAIGWLIGRVTCHCRKK